MNFVKALNKYEPTLKYMWSKCSYLRDVKIKEEIFIGGPIREILTDKNFILGNESWESFTVTVTVVHIYSTNKSFEKYKEFTENFLQQYQQLDGKIYHPNIDLFSYQLRW